MLAFGLKSLISSWTQNFTVLVDLFHENFAKDVVVRLVDIPDLPVLSGIQPSLPTLTG
jgi:hypothetical protein